MEIAKICQWVNNLPYVMLCVTVSANETITVCVIERIEGDVTGDFDKGFGVFVKLSLSFGLSQLIDDSIVTMLHFSTTCSILKYKIKRKGFSLSDHPGNY